LIFFSDLDNTLIHSYKRAEEGDICVETRDGKKLSYMRPNDHRLLREANDMIEFVPVTTRTVEQYRRVALLEGDVPRFALVCNGAVLLRGGYPCEKWQARTNSIFQAALCRISDYAVRLKSMPDDFYDVRVADGFFIFAKCTRCENETRTALAFVDAGLFSVYFTFEKVYIMPKELDKGFAVKRFAESFGAGRATVSAGDSLLDLPMLQATDKAFVPFDFPHEGNFSKAPDANFAEFILTNIINEARILRRC
jgi:hydroxymethylpyrimidine pyrophosphatase-like HAD family hydrolase